MPAFEKEVVVAAFAKYGVVIHDDDPIVPLGLVLSMYLERASGQFEEVLTPKMDGLKALVESIRAERIAYEKSVIVIQKAGLDTLRQALVRLREDEQKAADYRIEEFTQRALSAAGGDHRFKDRFIGVLVGFTMALAAWSGFMYFLKH